MDPVGHWRNEHAYFSQLLALLQKELDVFHRGEAPNYELMQDIVKYLHDYSDQYHHPREDVAFRRLVGYCPDLELVIARLEQEHRVIANAGEKLGGMIDAVLAGSMVPRAEMEVAAATYLVYYGNHIAKEDEDILGRAGAALKPADWEAVKNAVPLVADPVFGQHSGSEYRELRRQIAREA